MTVFAVVGLSYRQLDKLLRWTDAALLLCATGPLTDMMVVAVFHLVTGAAVEVGIKKVAFICDRYPYLLAT